MDVQQQNPIGDIIERVADYLAERGYAYVEDDKLDDLAAALTAALRAAAIPIHSGVEVTSPARGR